MKKCLALLIGSLLLMASPASAYSNGSHDVGLGLETIVQHSFKSGIKGSDTEVSRSRYGVQASYSIFTLGYDYSHFSWDDAGDAGFTPEDGTPWDGLHNFFLSAEAVFPLAEKWLLYSRAGVNSSFEKEISGSFGIGGAAILFREFRNNWFAGLGLVGGYHPVRSLFIPAAGLLYGFPGDVGWTARIGIPTTEVRYGFSESFALQAGLGYSSRMYRLKNNSPVADKGYFRERNFSVGMQVEWSPMEKMALKLGPYYKLGRKWQVYDRHKSRIISKDVKSTPVVEARLSWRF